MDSGISFVLICISLIANDVEIFSCAYLLFIYLLQLSHDFHVHDFYPFSNWILEKLLNF